MRRGAKWLLVLGVFLALFVVVGVLATLSVGTGPRVPRHAVLWVKLGSEIAEEDRRSPLERALGRRTLTVRDYLRVLRAAAADPRIEAAVVELQRFGGGWATATELRDALSGFRETGKPLLAFMEYGGNLDYYLASASDHVVMVPGGMLLVNGLLADVPFYKGTLDKVGIKADLEHIGDYKSASELYTRDSMSDAQREATNLILDGIYDTYVSSVARARALGPEAVTAALDEGFLTAERAKGLRLIDEVLYKDELIDSLTERLGSKPEQIKVAPYLGSLPEGRGRERIGLVYITGTIVPGESTTDPLGGSLVGSDTVAEALQKVREDTSIRAVILRVDSPGGSGLASDVIWREVELTRQEKPVVVSMSDVAASGGYYVAMGASAIVAQPNTLTGSIGVISGKFCLRGFYDWVALRREQIKRGVNADILTDYQEFTPAQRALVRTQMEAFYKGFVHKAAAGRKRTEQEIDAVAQGRVWTGAQAKERNLVDELGGLDKALELARREAGVPENRPVTLVVFPKPKGWLESLFPRGVEDSLANRILAGLLPTQARRMLGDLRVRERLQAEPFLCLDEGLAALH